MSVDNLQKVLAAKDDHFYDTREMDFEMDKVAATDDYGLNRVPGNWRFSAWQTFWSWSGLSTSLAYPLTGALLAFAFGAAATIIGFIITAIIVGLGVYYMSRQSTNEGIGKDLISRASFGYKGSIFTSLFGGLFVVVLFSLETSVIARSLSEYFTALPFWGSAAIICAAFVPIGIYGMVWINKIQNFTLWLYLIGIALAVIALYAGWSDQAQAAFAGDWWKLNPANAPFTFEKVLAAAGSWLGAFGFISMIAVTDVTRMTRRKEGKKGAVLMVLINGLFNSVLIGLYGIFILASTKGINPDPGVTFVWLLGSFGLVLVLITQLRINVMNMYLGTLAWDSAFAQLSGKKLNRSWLLAPFIIAGYIVTISPLLAHFTTIASYAGVLYAAMVGSIIGEQILVRRSFGIPKWKEFRRAYLQSFNWIGFGSFIISSLIGILSLLGSLGGTMRDIAVLISGMLAFVLPRLIADMLGKEKTVKQYFARVPVVPESTAVDLTCPISGETNHRSDFVQCPFHNAWISSLSCATESKCNKICQTSAASKSINTGMAV